MSYPPVDPYSQPQQGYQQPPPYGQPPQQQYGQPPQEQPYYPPQQQQPYQPVPPTPYQPPKQGFMAWVQSLPPWLFYVGPIVLIVLGIGLTVIVRVVSADSPVAFIFLFPVLIALWVLRFGMRILRGGRFRR
jgi:hypothetical protein